MILAIDPGPTESAFVLYGAERPWLHGKIPNGELLDEVRQANSLRGPYAGAIILVVELIACYGMPVGREVFDTCIVTGRLLEAWGLAHALLTRGAVKLHLCGSMRAKDGNVRAALLDRWGGKAKAIGNKAAPGPLRGVSGDVWAALALAVTYADRTGPDSGAQVRERAADASLRGNSLFHQGNNRGES